MKTAEYIDHVKAQRNEARAREADVTKALRRFVVLHVRQQDGGHVKDSEWIEAIMRGKEVLEITTDSNGGKSDAD